MAFENGFTNKEAVGFGLRCFRTDCLESRRRWLNGMMMNDFQLLLSIFIMEFSIDWKTVELKWEEWHDHRVGTGTTCMLFLFAWTKQIFLNMQYDNVLCGWSWSKREWYFSNTHQQWLVDKGCKRKVIEISWCFWHVNDKTWFLSFYTQKTCEFF